MRDRRGCEDGLEPPELKRFHFRLSPRSKGRCDNRISRLSHDETGLSDEETGEGRMRNHPRTRPWETWRRARTEKRGGKRKKKEHNHDAICHPLFFYFFSSHKDQPTACAEPRAEPRLAVPIALEIEPSQGLGPIFSQVRYLSTLGRQLSCEGKRALTLARGTTTRVSTI